MSITVKTTWLGGILAADQGVVMQILHEVVLFCEDGRWLFKRSGVWLQDILNYLLSLF